MLNTRAVVIRLEGREALVESTQGGGCGHCDSENGCGSGKLSQLFCSEPRRFRALNNSNAQVGAVVQISVQEGVLLRSAILMYVLPLLMLLAGAVLAGLWAPDDSRDAWSAAAGVIGLVAGFVLVKILSLRPKFVSAGLPLISPLPDVS
jgi:sigma-E factor negative regulatory protein RseC